MTGDVGGGSVIGHAAAFMDSLPQKRARRRASNTDKHGQLPPDTGTNYIEHLVPALIGSRTLSHPHRSSPPLRSASALWGDAVTGSCGRLRSVLLATFGCPHCAGGGTRAQPWLTDAARTPVSAAASRK